MLLRQVVLPPSVPGRLWLSAMPGRTQAWGEFVAEAQGAGLGLVVCLTQRDEMQEISPAYARAVARGEPPFDRPGAWLHLPARNFGPPSDPQDFRQGIDTIAQRLEAGDAVLLHCAAGMGRTGTAAACVLKRLGLPTAQAMQRVQTAGSNPQNALQSGVVDWF